MVLAPPYDVISPSAQREYCNRHRYNIVNVDFRPDIEGEDKYEVGGKLFREWKKEGVLALDHRPAIYVHEQYFTDWEGYRRTRRGFIARLKLEEFGAGSVYPHEKTFSKHKQDRLNMFRNVNAQMNPVFSIYPDLNGIIAPLLKKLVDITLPDLNFRFHDGVTNSLWRLTDEKTINTICEAMAQQPVFIADGHHRYETSLNYAREMREKEGIPEGQDSPYDYTLMYFVSMEDDGLSVLSAHRMLKNIPDFDEKTAMQHMCKNFVSRKSSRNEAMEVLSKSSQAHVMVMQIGTKFFVVRPKEEALLNNEVLMKMHESLRDLEVTICQELAIRPLIGRNDPLDHMWYEIDPMKVARKVEKGSYQAAFYLPPTRIRQMTRVARAMQVMPHKSTYFYPKLLTGLVIHSFSDNN